MFNTNDLTVIYRRAGYRTSPLTCRWQVARGAGLYASWRVELATYARSRTPGESNFQRTLVRL